VTSPASPALGGPRLYLRPGKLLAGRYEVRGEIGRGGYSAVYAARDQQLDIDVAVKLLVPPPAVAEVARERMRREVQLVRGLTHEHIVAVHDYVDDGERTFVIMDLVDGTDVAARVAANGPLPASEVLALGADVAAALAEAHARGVLHRDVKPQNILIDGRHRARLTDFGSARLDGQMTLTRTGALVGTLGYAAPEVFAGRRPDARADVYALGVTLYFALVGRLPDSASPHLPPEPAEAGFHPRQRRAEVPAWLNAIVADATRANAADRLPTARSLGDALARGEMPDEPIVSPLAIRETRCLVCGEPDPLGRTVCGWCSAGDRGAADTLIVVRGEGRARAAVPASVARDVIERLRRDGTIARAYPAGLAIAAVPLRAWALIGGVLGAGFLAARVVDPSLVFPTSLMGALLVFAAERSMRQPVRTRAALRNVPSTVAQRITETFAGLPAGTARSLLAVLTRHVRTIFALLGRRGDARGLGADVEELYTACCTVAFDLAEVDGLLDSLAEADGTPLKASNGDATSQLERARDAYAQRLLDATGELRAMCAGLIDANDDAAHRIGELSAELAREHDAQRSAMDEVRTLLAQPATR
jgi:hypothetical protein